MAESTAIFNKRDVILVITDGAAHSYTVAYEPGDFTFSVPNRSVSLYLDRGEITSPPSIRVVDDQPITGSFSVYARDIGDSTYATLADICNLYASGGYVASNWTSTHTGVDLPKTWTLTATFDGTFKGETDKTLTFSYVVFTASFKDGDPSSFDVSWTAYSRLPVRA